MSGRQVLVKVADRAVGEGSDVLVTLGLGSCVAVVLHDPDARVGGLAHVLLPEPEMARDRSNSSKFASTSIPLLLEELEALGADRGRITSRIVGGASMFGALMTSRSMNMGAKNIETCRRVLDDLDLRLDREEVGGEHGRSVRFEVSNGRLVVTAALRDDVVL